MWTEALEVSDDMSAGAWIAPRLARSFGAVTRTLPGGYAAYARVCHPAKDGDGRPVTWSQVAEATGRTSHPLMQWHAVVGSSDPDDMRGSPWNGHAPERGNLVPEVLRPLCDVLADHTATPERCFFCLWEGYGWITSASVPAVVLRRKDDVPVDGNPAAAAGSDERTPAAFSAEELSRPRVHLPNRSYLLLVGSLRAALQIGWRLSAKRFIAQSPNLFWPADRAWCVASEIDFDSTLVGGTAALIDAIMEQPTFDSWRVEPDDSLAIDADLINPSSA